MDKKQAQNEVSYRVLKIVLLTLLSEGLITESEFDDARKQLVNKLKPIVGGLE